MAKLGWCLTGHCERCPESIPATKDHGVIPCQCECHDR